VAKVSQPYYKDEENATWTEYNYDVLGRESHRINADNNDFYTRYNYLTVEIENPGNHDTPAQVTTVINNIFGQAIESIDPDNNSTFYSYNGRGKLVNTTDTKGNIATITYDDTFGRKTAMNDPDLGAWSYEYDALGRLIAQTDANGQRTEMTYDILNRLIKRVDDIGVNEEVTTWEYSKAKGNGQLIGSLHKVISPNYERSVKYDDFSRVIETTSLIDEETFTQKAGYMGTADKVDWIEYPSGLAVRNTYDNYGFPKTVEKITLDYAKYLEFQSASQTLNTSQRQLEVYKNAYLNNVQLNDLEEHERQVRLMGKVLSDFYNEFDQHPDKIAYEEEALRYSGDEEKGIDGLLLRVQQKIEQHTAWYNTYQSELDTRYDNIKDDLERLELIPDLAAPYERAFGDAEKLWDDYLDKENYYAGELNRYGTVINNNFADINSEINKINAQIAWMNSHIDALFYPHIATIYKNHVDVMFDELDNHNEYVFNNYLKPEMRSDYAFSFHVGKMGEAITNIGNHNINIEAIEGRIVGYQKTIDDNNWDWLYDHWSTRRQNEGNKMASAVSKINQYNSEITTLSDRVTPDLDRINNWLAPITQSHNNVILAFNERARLYVEEISQRMGGYVEREDLKSENFLKPFQNHVEYIRCLRDQSSKSMGDCYKDNLVHVFNDDGTVDTAKQTAARAKVEDDTVVDIKQFWRNKRFFCSEYYGYSCPDSYSAEIKQLAKTLHIHQCTRMTAKQKEKSSVTCDISVWNTQAKVIAGTNPYLFPYLESNVIEFSSNLNNYYTALVTAHEAEVEWLVSDATYGTYNAETHYHDIIQLGGNLWSASSPEAVAEGESDPREFVLLHKGDVQKLAAAEMDRVGNQMLADGEMDILVNQVREANFGLRTHQYAIAQLINGVEPNDPSAANDGLPPAYDRLYLAVQNNAETAGQLYNEIDQAYAQAASDDSFDEEAFNDDKKIYWQAEDINSKGQILKAKYGNGTVTEWDYDQFGRIIEHKTLDALGLTNIIENTYQYDAVGNLTQRVDKVEKLTEDFSYDNLNRLLQNRLSGTGAALAQEIQQGAVNYGYDELGNLTSKSDIANGGRYTYGKPSIGHAGPHAVTDITGLGDFTYDNNGNQLTGNGRTIVYNAANKPILIVKDGEKTTLAYGPERELLQQQQPIPGGLETTTYVGGLFEQVQVGDGAVTNKHYIAVAGNTIAVVETEAASPTVVSKESYLHKNHQSSVLAISDALGQIGERRYYDAFGEVKTYVGQAASQYLSGITFTSITTMAFTGHKTLVAAGVIHMGGRVYDATIGRFLSADPFIQSPLNSQSLNRYSYVWNNPLSMVDPSGYFTLNPFKTLKKLFNKIKKIIKAVLKVVKKVIRAIAKVVKKIGQYVKKYWQVIVMIAIAFVAPIIAAKLLPGLMSGGLGAAVAAGAVGGGLSGLVTTGSLTGALKGALLGGITAGIGFGVGKVVGKPGIGKSLGKSIGKTFTLGKKGVGALTGYINSGFSGGIINKLQGGSFSKGFVNAVKAAVVMSAVASVGRWVVDKVTRDDNVIVLVTKGGDAKQRATAEKNPVDLQVDVSSPFNSYDEASNALRGNLRAAGKGNWYEWSGAVVETVRTVEGKSVPTWYITNVDTSVSTSYTSYNSSTLSTLNGYDSFSVQHLHPVQIKHYEMSEPSEADISSLNTLSADYTNIRSLIIIPENGKHSYGALKNTNASKSSFGRCKSSFSLC
jgi:RHS repeat-associated protein